ncbi:hypothetical protein EUGRSUZ_F03940 [Eucalyptus grandis]|uniref:Uncharacterized protein n=2 Tax=Eucalyptus grandis TaxID=71139 RepID=A0ACC3KQF4_EUCGR|nr:hypothetical protein EUGRSUZ_F03940 [Eucalyptus grandis]
MVNSRPRFSTKERDKLTRPKLCAFSCLSRVPHQDLQCNGRSTQSRENATISRWIGGCGSGVVRRTRESTARRSTVVAEQVTFNFLNRCPFSIWPAMAPNTGQPVIAEGGFYLQWASRKLVSVPPGWKGRIWARTGCSFASNRPPTCETGDCGQLRCRGLIGTPPATLVQVWLHADEAKPSFYNISLVDGFNLPISVQTRPTQPECEIPGCSKPLNGLCPEELQVMNGKGKVVACKSACLAFNTDEYCCRNEYATPDKCKPSVYSRLFKDACPGYYSHPYDSPRPQVSCASKEFEIIFCPNFWGVEQGKKSK